MRGNELLLMTATPDVGGCLLALLRPATCSATGPACSGGAEPAPEPLATHAHAAGALRRDCLNTDTIDLLRKEIGLQTPAAAS